MPSSHSWDLIENGSVNCKTRVNSQCQILSMESATTTAQPVFVAEAISLQRSAVPRSLLDINKDNSDLKFNLMLNML